ncbi:MAG: tetratricopeptide repeat protein [Methylacidiphilales bacterium]|nr:tetratricopeptide repeat protein [Candidatus Methylacidiphilales bacterium]
MSSDALIAKYEALLQQRPNDELILFSLGKALYDAGRIPEAEARLAAALKAKPDWMVVTMLLAKIALQRNDSAAARAHYESALKMAIDQEHEGPENEIRAALAKLD